MKRKDYINGLADQVMRERSERLRQSEENTRLMKENAELRGLHYTYRLSLARTLEGTFGVYLVRYALNKAQILLPDGSWSATEEFGLLEPAISITPDGAAYRKEVVFE